ncbi:MAG: T9SS type A sorting domain-containing protein [Chloroherpetonaceae bacterium]
MKRIFIFFLATVALMGQDFEPTQVKFKYGQDSIFLSTEDPRFQQRGFMLGWHWGNGPTLSNALKMSQAHEATRVPGSLNGPLIDVPDSYFRDSVDIIMNTPVVGHHWDKFSPVLGISMQWEPALLIDNPPEFKTIIGDTTRPIFGFKTIVGEIIDSRLKLSSNIPNGTIVLTDNWPDDALYRSIDITADNIQYNVYGWDAIHQRPIPNYPIFYRDYNGTDLYLSLNLRREDISTVQNNDNVLAIRIKYYTPSEDSGWVQFTNLPYPQKDSIINLPYNRGKARVIDNTNFDTTFFYIKKSMLPISTDSGRKDITISAKMIFDDSIDNHNFRLRTSWSDTISTHIARLKIEVTYLDNSTPISIDWVRIESKVAQDLFRGYYDSAIVANARVAITHLTTTEFQNRGIRPYRFYLKDEHLPEHWGAHRYINKLIGDICVDEARFRDIEQSNAYPLQRMYYLELPEFWAALNSINSGNALVPYVRSGHNSDDPLGHLGSFGINGGYARSYWGPSVNNFNIYDTLHSDYETNVGGIFNENGHWVRNRNFTDIKAMNAEQYRAWLYGIDLTQEVIERSLYDLMCGPKYQKYLFSGQKWWLQNWVGNDLTLNSVPLGYQDNIGNDTVLIGAHSVSGEEASQAIWQPLILGAKGLIYDLEASDGYPTRIGIWHGQKYFNKTTDDTTDHIDIPVNHRLTQAQRTALLASDTALLYSDLVGGDWITIPTGPNDVPPNDSLWDYTRIQDYLPKYSRMKDFLGLETNKLYIGRKSARTSMYKIHKWVRANEETLMKLRLQAWLGKGYRKWYAQGSQITSDTMMKQYIDIGNIKTRPIGRVDANGNPYYEQSSIDSGFYDITILKDTTSPNDTGIYLGVQNRRTDPLIYDVVNNKMIFTPTAEFDQHVQSGADTSLWQSRWWKRQGAREIRIPVNPSFNNFNAKTVSVRELNNLSDWFANEPYNNVIDTMLEVAGGDGYIIVKLLPGQGKILRIEFETGDTIGNVVKNNDVKIILNPSMNKISAIFKHPIPKNSKAYIFDYGGRKLLEANGKDFIDEYKIEMDIAQLPSGAYFFSVYSNSKLITDKKFIILK